MRILFLCNKPPYPPKDGGSLAINTLVEGLLDAGHQVKILSVNAPKYGINEKDIPEEYLQKTGLELIDVDLSIKKIPALYYLLVNQSYQLKRFYHSRFAARLSEVLGQGWDIVQLETVFPGVYFDLIRKNSTAGIILRAHNIEHHIWKQLYANTSNLFIKFYLKRVTSSLRKFELSLFGKVDGIAAISSRISAYIEMKNCRTVVRTVPFGLELSKYPLPPGSRGEKTVFHIGSMNWKPNEEGIKWFLKEVWPIVCTRKPGTVLRLAGRNMPDWLTLLSEPGVEIIGEVADSWKFICQNGIMIVPLLSGSGVRIKIIEGMLAGKAIVSTVKGAEGIDCQDNNNILLANDAAAFGAAVIRCLEEPGLTETIGINAREHILKHHNSKLIIPELLDLYQVILNDH